MAEEIGAGPFDFLVDRRYFQSPKRMGNGIVVDLARNFARRDGH